MNSSTEPPMFDDIGGWLEAFLRPSVLVELVALAGCGALAWVLVSALRRSVRQVSPRSILFGRKVIDGVLFPLVLLGLGMLARALLFKW